MAGVSDVVGVTDEDGNYDVTLTITKSEISNDIDRIVLIGDPVANQFPTVAYLDGSDKAIYSDDFKWEIAFDNPAPVWYLLTPLPSFHPPGCLRPPM